MFLIRFLKNYFLLPTARRQCNASTRKKVNTFALKNVGGFEFPDVTDYYKVTLLDQIALEWMDNFLSFSVVFICTDLDWVMKWINHILLVWLVKQMECLTWDISTWKLSSTVDGIAELAEISPELHMSRLIEMRKKCAVINSILLIKLWWDLFAR